MTFIGIKRTFSTVGDGQYETIGAFWDEMSSIFGRENLMGLGFGWTDTTIDYCMALKTGVIDGADFEIELPDENLWTEVNGLTEELGKIYNKIYESGVLKYEIEEFDDLGNCRIRYIR